MKSRKRLASFICIVLLSISAGTSFAQEGLIVEELIARLFFRTATAETRFTAAFATERIAQASWEASHSASSIATTTLHSDYLSHTLSYPTAPLHDDYFSNSLSPYSTTPLPVDYRSRNLLSRHNAGLPNGYFSNDELSYSNTELNNYYARALKLYTPTRDRLPRTSIYDPIVKGIGRLSSIHSEDFNAYLPPSEYPQWDNYVGKTLREFARLNNLDAKEVTRVIRANTKDPKNPIESFQRENGLTADGVLNENTFSRARFLSDIDFLCTVLKEMPKENIPVNNVAFTSNSQSVPHIFRNGEGFFAQVENPKFGSSKYIFGSSNGKGGTRFRQIDALTYWTSFDEAVSKNVGSITDATFLYINCIPDNKGNFQFTIGHRTGTIAASKLEQFIKNKRPISELSFLQKMAKTNIILLRNKNIHRNDVGLVIALRSCYGKQHSFYLATDFDKALNNLKQIVANPNEDYKILAPTKDYNVNDYNVVRNLVGQGVAKEKFSIIAPKGDRIQTMGSITIGHKSMEYKAFIMDAIDKTNNGSLIDVSCYEKGYEDFLTEFLAKNSTRAVMSFGCKIDATASSYVLVEYFQLKAIANNATVSNIDLWNQSVELAVEKNAAHLNKKMIIEIQKMKNAAFIQVSFMIDVQHMPLDRLISPVVGVVIAA